jgi:fluoroquinolone resistance protein
MPKFNTFDAKKDYASQEFKGSGFDHQIVNGKNFDSCAFLRCSFREAAFQKCNFYECSFRECDLSLVKLAQCTFRNTQFEDSQIIGVDWTSINPTQKFALHKPFDFIKCALNHCTFLGSNLTQVRITKCIARNVSFEEADLTRADCTFTDFAESRFLRTNLTETDFSGATNYAISANLNTLKKTRFSLPEAMALLSSLDIVLTEYPPG